MDGIAIGCSPTLNAMLVYSPQTKKYYKLDSYCLDPYWLPSLVYPDLRYDGGLFCSLVCDNSTPMEELYPPGTRVERIDPTAKLLVAGTVMDTPISTDVLGSPSYLILFDNSTSASLPLPEMQSMILALPVPMTNTAASPLVHSSLLLLFLSVNSQITYNHEGTYHEGFLSCKPCGTYCFSFKTPIKKKSKDWGIDLLNLPFNWADLCTKGILIPSHAAHTFICPAPSPVTLVSASSTSTFDPVASIVSAINLHCDCPPSLLQALVASHPDREVWLQSYYEEKSAIESLGTFKRLTLGEYCALWEKGAPKAIPTMCVLLTIKKEEQLLPLRAKSRIVVLGNCESHDWSKSDWFAPILRFNSLRFLVSLAVQHRRGLKQRDCENAFCQGILPPEEVTIVRPLSGDPDAVKDEY